MNCYTGPRATANAYAERFVRTVRTECLDHLLILGSRHLERVLRIYIQHYTRERPHRGLGLRPSHDNSSHRPAATSTAATASWSLARVLQSRSLSEPSFDTLQGERKERAPMFPTPATEDSKCWTVGLGRQPVRCEGLRDLVIARA